MTDIPKYYFSFDEFIEKLLKDDQISILKIIEACYIEIDRVNKIPKNRLSKYENDSLIYYLNQLRGLTNFLINDNYIDDEVTLKKYLRIKKHLTKNNN